MGERHDAEHSVAQARQRLSTIAEELSRRASGDYVKERAREVADEFAVRAKVKARERTYEMRDRFLESPWALGLIGGTVGAIAGKLIGQKTREMRGGRYDVEIDERYGASWERPYDEYSATHRPYGGEYQSTLITDDTSIGTESAGVAVRPGFEAQSDWSEGDYGADAGGEQGGKFDAIKGKASDLGGRAKGAVSDVSGRARHVASNAGERARHVASNVGGKARHMASNVGEHARHAAHLARERIPSREQLRGGVYRVRHNAEDYAPLWAFGAMLAGAFFGAMVPVSRKERSLLGPAKEELKEGIRTFKHEAVHKAQEIKQGFVSGVQGQEQQQGEDQARSYGGGMEGSFDAGVSASAEDTSASTGGYSAGAAESPSYATVESSPGTFSTGGIGSSENKNEQGGTWTPAYDPDVTRH